MAANKNNINAFKQFIQVFVKKRTEVVIKINKITKSMPSNDRTLYKMTEQCRLRVKDAEVKARNHCVRTQQEKGSSVKLIEFFDENIKKYEF